MLKLLGHETIVPTVYGATGLQHAYRVLTDKGEVLAPELPDRRTKSSLVFDLGRNEQGRRSYVTEVQNARCYQENGVSGPFLLADCRPSAFAGQFVLQTIPGKLAFAYRSRVGSPWLYAELLGVPEHFDPQAYEDYEDRRVYRNVWPGVHVWLRLWPDRAAWFYELASPEACHLFTARVVAEDQGKLVMPERIITPTGIISGKSAVEAAYRDGVTSPKLVDFGACHLREFLVHDAKGEPVTSLVYGYKEGLRTQQIPVQPASRYPLWVDTDVEEQVPATEDDGFRYGATGLSVTSQTTRFGDVSGSDQHGFYRFTTVAVDKAATIGSAYMSFCAGADNSTTTCALLVYCNDVDNAVAPTTYDEFDALALTASAAWTAAAWVTGNWYNSASIVTPVQAVVNRTGWATGNAVTLVVKSNTNDRNANRQAVDYTQSAASAAKLVFSWSAGGGEAYEGTVDISGVGSAAVTGVKAASVSVAISGIGSVDVTGQKTDVAGAVTITGIGDAVLVGVKHAYGSFSISAVGSAAITGVKGGQDSIVLSVVGSTEATGTKAAQGQVSIAGVGDAEATATKAVSGQVEVSGIGDATVSGTKAVGSSVAMAGVGDAEAVGSKGGQDSISISGVGDAAATGAKAALGQVEVSGIGDAELAGTKAAAGSVSITGIGSAEATGTKAASGQVAVAGIGDASLSGQKHAFGTVAISGVGAVEVTGTAGEAEHYEGIVSVASVGSVIFLGQKRARSPPIEIAAVGDVTLTGQSARSGTVAVTGIGDAEVTGEKASQDSVAIAAVGSVSATGQKQGQGSVDIAAVGSDSVSGQKNAKASAEVSGVGSTEVSGTKATSGSVDIAGTGSVAVTGQTGRSGSVAISGVGSVAVEGTADQAPHATGTVAISARGSVSVQGRKTVSGTVSISGVGSLESTARTARFGTVSPSGIGSITLEVWAFYWSVQPSPVTEWEDVTAPGPPAWTPKVPSDTAWTPKDKPATTWTAKARPSTTWTPKEG